MSKGSKNTQKQPEHIWKYFQHYGPLGKSKVHFWIASVKIEWTSKIHSQECANLEPPTLLVKVRQCGCVRKWSNSSQNLRAFPVAQRFHLWKQTHKKCRHVSSWRQPMQEKVPAAQTQPSSLDLIPRWKERTNSKELASDLHIQPWHRDGQTRPHRGNYKRLLVGSPRL